MDNLFPFKTYTKKGSGFQIIIGAFILVSLLGLHPFIRSDIVLFISLTVVLPNMVDAPVLFFSVSVSVVLNISRTSLLASFRLFNRVPSHNYMN